MIEFSTLAVAMVVKETIGTAALPVTRGPGVYGDVAVQFNVSAGMSLTSETNEKFQNFQHF